MRQNPSTTDVQHLGEFEVTNLGLTLRRAGTFAYRR